MQAEPNPLSCQHCGGTFQRREHRDRHVLRHTGLKPFHCDICDKSFSRSDTLQRHRTLHGDGNEGAPRSPGHRATQACLPCARLKQRCDGRSPCARCLLRSARCQYAPGRSSGPARGAAARPGSTEDGASSGRSSNVTEKPSQTRPAHAAGSPLGTQTTDAIDHGPVPVDLPTLPGAWRDHRAIHSSLQSLPATLPHLVPTSLPEGTAIEPQGGSAYAAGGPFGGGSVDFIDIIDDPWMPWNPMATNSSFPWTLEGLGVMLDQAQANGHVLSFTPSASHHCTASSPIAEASPRQESAQGPSRHHPNPRDMGAAHTRPCRPFPELQALSLELAGAEMYGHIPHLPEHTSEGLHGFYRVQTQDPAAPLLHDRVLHAFIELYFEHFDPQFPFLHPCRLGAPEVPWIVLLAAAAVGSHYSEIPDAQRYNLTLVDLLARAVESSVSEDILRTDIVVVQCVFLLHVLWMFSGSHKEKIMLQHRRSMLVTLCWDLLSRADLQRKPAADSLGVEAEWQTWMLGEEEVRLVTCVRVLDCLGSLFLDIPTIFKLRDATCQFPSPEHLWKCRNAQDWKSCYRCLPAYQAERKRSRSDEDWSRTMLVSELFASKATLLELFIDERALARQMSSSQHFRSAVVSFLGTPNTGSEQATAPPSLAELDFERSDNTLLETSVDLLSFAALDGSASVPYGLAETLFHALAILRRVPLDIIHTATGWKTNKETMHKSKMKFRDFCQQNVRQARRCLWHATCIFRATRSSRMLACYDVFSIMVATSYIYCYCGLHLAAARGGSTPPRSTPPAVVRLDQLRDRPSIERWIEGADDHSLIHLTGVGLLDGSDDCVRFLRDIERTLESQVAWRVICCAFAGCFAQLRRGEMPTPGDPKGDEDGIS